MPFAVIGLTGGTGAGKGAVSGLLEELGIPCLDTDKVSRAVCEKGMPCLAALAGAFGGDILDEDGALKRKDLAALVFGEPDETKKQKKLDTLNQITHKYILDACRTWLGEQRTAGKAAAVIDAPQLFESGFDRECTFLLGVTAETETRIARVMSRDGISREAAEQRIAAQHDDAFFAARCDAVLANNGTVEALLPGLTEILHTWGIV